MRIRFVLAALVLTVTPFGARAQSAPTVQMECHDLASSGNFLQPNETLVNGLACHTVKPAENSAPAATPAPAPAAAAPVPAPQPAPVAAPSAEAQATIYFYRPKRFQGSALKPTVFVDDARVGRLHNGDSIKFDLAPGDHKIYSTDKSTGMDIDAKPGQTYYVRVDIQTGFWKGHGGVTLVDPQEGKYEVGQAAHHAADDDN